MKFRAILMVLAALIVMSCQEKSEPTVTVNDPNLSSLTYTCLEDKTTVPISASQDWTATASAPWITVTPAKGAKGSHFITISVSANGPDGDRSGNVQITAGSAVLTISVRQSEQKALQLATDWVEVAQEGGEVTFQVTANVDFTSKVEEGNDWISIIGTKALKTSTITLSVKPNNSVKSRTGKLAISGADGLNGSVSVMQAGGKVKAFNENDVVASFGVMSDTHLDKGTNMPATKLFNAFTQLKTEASKHDKDGLDGILIAGDLIQNACNTTEISSWKSTYESAFGDASKMPLVYSLGNHDVSGWWSTKLVSDGQVFRNIFGSSYYLSDQDKVAGESLECRHCLIKGVNVIAISPISNTPVNYDAKATAWLDAKLQELTSAAPDRYVLLLTHPMIHNTVYGSNLVSAGYLTSDSSVPSYWYTTSLTPILKKYPQVIAFGGHLHFPINDPCSIWQGDFTVMGCGSGRYMAFEGGEKYVNKSSATVLNDANDFSQGYLLQVDASGNVRMTRMDFFHNQTIGDAWELPFPDAAGKSHLEIFSNARRAAENEAPRLSSLEIVKGSTSLANVPCTAKWAAAQDEDFAHHYELTWTSPSGSKTVWIMSDYYLHAKPADMKKTWEYTLGSFPAGSYSATLVAVDSWGKSSAPLTKQFTVENASTPSDPGSLPSAYVDFAFDGTVRDVNDKVTVTNFGGSVTSATVSVGGKSKSVPAFVTTDKTTYAMCQFKEFTSEESMKSLMLGGFTVEAFYVDKDKTDGQTHGVVCGTEYGGWGLAETKDRMPYFIVGDGARNTYKSVYATSAASASELTHVVAAYDPSSSKLTIYINGALQATSSFSSTFFPGEGDSFNRFCLGADIKKGNAGTDFPSKSMVIADAKIYTVALNAAQAALAYDKAKKELGF